MIKFKINNFIKLSLFSLLLVSLLFNAPTYAEDNSISKKNVQQQNQLFKEFYNSVKIKILQFWNETKEYQIKGWEDGKEQLARNKEEIKAIPYKITDTVKTSALGIGEFVQVYFKFDK